MTEDSLRPPAPAGQVRSPIRILCAADEAFAPQLCVMLTSLLDHHPHDRGIEIYVFASELPDPERRKIEASLTRSRPGFDVASLHWLSPDRSILQGLHVSLHVSLETYSRVLAPFVLPADFDRILYLDCDMVVVSDLSELYDSPFNGAAVLAARDLEVANVAAPTGVFNYRELGIPPETRYFNGGVLLINLQRWREEKISDQILTYLNAHKGAVHFWDQGGMNAIMHDSWGEVDPAWNQTRVILFPQAWKELGYARSEWKRTKDHPKIVHFTGPAKPWLPRMHRPGYSYFFKYLERTSYAGVYKSPLPERFLGGRIYYALWYACRQAGQSLKKLIGR